MFFSCFIGGIWHLFANMDLAVFFLFLLIQVAGFITTTFMLNLMRFTQNQEFAENIYFNDGNEIIRMSHCL